MFKINLVPEVQEKKQQLAKTNSTVVTVSIVAVCITAAILVIIGGVVLANNNSIKKTNESILSTKSEISQYAELEKTVISLENGLTSAKKILDGQNSWTKLLPHLEAATPNDVKFTKITLEPGKITASLEGKDINSLARFVESFKNYQLVVFSGKGNWGDTVSVAIDGGTPATVAVKSNGTWNYAVKMDLTKDHTITVVNNETTSTLKYDSVKKEITSEDGAVQTKIQNLYKTVEVKQYTKNGNITFDATITYDGGLLW
jgi:Tfp pilus assembly protein PilN